MEMFRGIFPAAITLFTETGALDTDALRKNIKRWNEYGLRDYVVTGSIAEAPFLEEAERDEIIRNTPADFAFLCGNSAAMVSSFMLGAVGGVLNTANLAPEICVALYRASQAVNFKVAQNLYHLLQPLSEVIGGARGIGGLKYAMTLLGYQAGFPRAPLSSPNEADQQMIKHVLQEANLLTV